MIAWASRPPAHRSPVVYCLSAPSLPQIALLIVVLGWQSSIAKIYSFCLAIACASFLGDRVSGLVFPSFGRDVGLSAAELRVICSTRLWLLDLCLRATTSVAYCSPDGPGFIAPSDLQRPDRLSVFSCGAVGVCSLPGLRAALKRYVFVPVLALNFLVLLSTPIQGGHHVVDVLAGFAAGGCCRSLSWPNG